MLRRWSGAGWLALCLSWCGASADGQPGVKCTKAMAGTFWPEAANGDAAVRKRAERCGTLLYCSRTTFGWKWQPLTVSLRAMMAKAAGEKAWVDAACATEDGHPEAAGEGKADGAAR